MLLYEVRELPASGYGLVEFRSTIFGATYEFHGKAVRTFSSLVFSFHLASRRVRVTPVGRPLDCFRLRCRDGGYVPVGKIRFIDPHAMQTTASLRATAVAAALKPLR